MQKTILRKTWSRYFSFDWKLGLFLITVFAVLRFFIALNNAQYGGSSAIFMLFLSMWFIPIILFTSEGRKAIGIKKPDRWIKLLYSFIAGIVFCGVSYLITYLLYGYSINNSFVYMSRVYGLAPEMLEAYRYKLFYISLFMSMIFSPIGEEFLYRGVIHGCFVDKYGENKASIIDSLVFMIIVNSSLKETPFFQNLPCTLFTTIPCFTRRARYRHRFFSPFCF